MKTDPAGRFIVTQGETVTITVTPSFGAGNQVVAVRDGDQNKNPFVFKVTKSPGQRHAVEMVFGFIGAPDGAQYTIKIDGEGQGNQGPFNRFVRKSSASHTRLYEFHVV
jgi:hypothetical protein